MIYWRYISSIVNMTVGRILLFFSLRHLVLYFYRREGKKRKIMIKTCIPLLFFLGVLMEGILLQIPILVVLSFLPSLRIDIHQAWGLTFTVSLFFFPVFFPHFPIIEWRLVCKSNLAMWIKLSFLNNHSSHQIKKIDATKFVCLFYYFILFLKSKHVKCQTSVLAVNILLIF